MDSTLGDRHFFNLDLFPEWKLNIWRKISEDARDKGAFASTDYFDNGLLKPYLAAYQPIFKWLHRKTSAAAMSDMEPMWEYRDDGQWQLLFIDTDEWLDVKGLGIDRAYAKKKTKRKRPQLGGMYVEGEVPGNGISEDVVVIEPGSIPRVEMAFPKTNRCEVM